MWNQLAFSFVILFLFSPNYSNACPTPSTVILSSLEYSLGSWWRWYDRSSDPRSGYLHSTNKQSYCELTCRGEAGQWARELLITAALWLVERRIVILESGGNLNNVEQCWMNEPRWKLAPIGFFLSIKAMLHVDLNRLCLSLWTFLNEWVECLWLKQPTNSPETIVAKFHAFGTFGDLFPSLLQGRNLRPKLNFFPVRLELICSHRPST